MPRKSNSLETKARKKMTEQIRRHLMKLYDDKHRKDFPENKKFRFQLDDVRAILDDLAAGMSLSEIADARHTKAETIRGAFARFNLDYRTEDIRKSRLRMLTSVRKKAQSAANNAEAEASSIVSGTKHIIIDHRKRLPHIKNDVTDKVEEAVETVKDIPGQLKDATAHVATTFKRRKQRGFFGTIIHAILG